jgi:excisionase family DNA binding protein
MDQQIVLSPVPLTDLVGQIVRAIRADMDNATPPPPEELQTREETARQLHVTQPTLRSYVRKGYVKSYRIGNRVLYKRNEVLDALQQMRTAKQAR